MARLPRLSVAGWPHLVVQRGHNREDAFRDAVDRTRFLEFLGDAARTHSLAIHAYGLRDNEVRLLCTPPTDGALSETMQALGRRYGAYFNRRHGRSGSVWEGRFKATVIEPARHLLDCMRFVEEGITERDSAPEEGSWSSAEHHTGRGTQPLVSEHAAYWALGNTPFEREVAYRGLLAQPLAPHDEAQLREAVLKGWPLGSPDFVAALARCTTRRLTPLAPGRPRLHQ